LAIIYSQIKIIIVIIIIIIKVNFALERAIKAKEGSRVIVLLFL